MIEVETPGGAVVEFPDGTPEEIIIEALSKLENTQPTSTPAPEGGFFDDIKNSFAGGTVRGIRDIVDGGAQFLTRGVEAAIPDSWPEMDAWAKRQVQDVEGINAEAEREYQDDWRKGEMRGKFDGGRLTGNIAGSLPLAAMPGAALGTVGRGALIGSTSAAMTPVYEGDYWDEKGTQLAIGAGTGGALNAAGRVLAPKVRPAVQRLMKDGVVPSPGQIVGGAVDRAEQALTSVPVLGSMISGARKRAVEDFNKSIASRVLMPIKGTIPKKMKPGREMADHVHRQVSNAYRAAVEKIDDIKIDPDFAKQIASLADDVSFLPKARADQFQKILRERVLGKMSGGRMDGRTMKGIDSDLGKMAARYRTSADGDQRALADALQDVQGFIRDLTLRNAPKGAKGLRAADKAWALLKRYENAAARQGADDGVFSAKQYKSAVRALDPSKDKSAFARGGALGQDYAEDAAGVLSNTLPNSGTADRSLSAFLLGGGATYVDPLLGAGAVAAMAPYSRIGQKAAAAALTGRPAAVQGLGRGLQYVSPAGAAIVPQGILERGQ